MPSAALLPKVSLVYSIGDQTKEAVCIYVWKPIEKAQMCGHEENWGKGEIEERKRRILHDERASRSQCNRRRGRRSAWRRKRCLIGRGLVRPSARRAPPRRGPDRNSSCRGREGTESRKDHLRTDSSEDRCFASAMRRRLFGASLAVLRERRLQRKNQKPAVGNGENNHQ